MSAYFIRRFLLIIPTFLGVTIIVFTITRLVPGGPLERQIMQLRQAAAAGESGSIGGGTISDPTSTIPKGALEEMKKAFDLDKPGYVAYFLWIKKIAKLDLGQSYSTREPVWDMIKQRFPVSIMFGLTGFLLSYLLSIPLGIYKALKHGSNFDFASSAIVFLGYSIPGWALGALLLVFFASGRFYDALPLGDIKTGSYQDLPSWAQSIDPEEDVSDDFGQFEWDKLSLSSRIIDTCYHMFLPVLCYTIGGFATLTMLMKNSLMENMGKDYIRTAFAKGLSPYRVVLIHALRNSLIPLATGLGHAIGIIMAGSYLIESVFNIDGIGYLGFNSLLSRDYTVVLGILAVNTVLTLLGNIFSDVLYALIDPRIRFE